MSETGVCGGKAIWRRRPQERGRLHVYGEMAMIYIQGDGVKIKNRIAWIDSVQK